MHWKVVLAILTCNILFMSASYTMLIPFLPMYLTHELGVTSEHVNLWSGIVFSASFVVSAIMAPIWGRLADTKGKRIMAIRASFLLSISYFLCGIVETPEQLALARMFQGFAAGLWPLELAIMTLYAPKEKLGFCLGTMQGVLTAGGVIGPLIGGLLAEAFGMRLSFYLAAGALFLNFLVFVFVIKEPPQAEEKEHTAPTSQRSILKIPLIRNMLLCAVLVQMIILILQPILTTYVEQLAGHLENIIFVAGLVFSLGGVAGAMTAPFWGTFGQRRGFFLSMTIGLFGAGSCMILQGLQSSIYFFALMQFLGGLFFSSIHPSINAILAQRTPADFKGRIFGMLFAAQQFGAIIGPIFGGLIATYLGMHVVFFAAGALAIFLSIFVRKTYAKEAT